MISCHLPNYKSLPDSHLASIKTLQGQITSNLTVEKLNKASEASSSSINHPIYLLYLTQRCGHMTSFAADRTDWVVWSFLQSFSDWYILIHTNTIVSILLYALVVVSVSNCHSRLWCPCPPIIKYMCVFPVLNVSELYLIKSGVWECV